MAPVPGLPSLATAGRQPLKFAGMRVGFFLAPADSFQTRGAVAMNRNTRRVLIVAAIVVAGIGALPNLASADSLSSVQWAGREATSDALHGKSVVILSFVTWCPICNKVTPIMLDEVKADTADKPVVVLAIATDVDASRAKAYMVQRNFVGPNILYGSNATMDTELGVDSKNLWNYAIYSPKGKLVIRGAACAYYPDDPKKLFSVSDSIHKSKAAKIGRFQFVSDGMSDGLKKFAWASEVGDLPQIALLSKPNAVESLASEDREQLSAIRSKVLDNQLAAVKRHFIGDVPDQIDAFHAAIKLSTTFPDAPQGKKAAKLAAALSSDPNFHKEVIAKKYFNAAIAVAMHGNDAQAKRMLQGVVDEYPDTFFGKQAKEALKSASVKPIPADATDQPHFQVEITNSSVPVH
jgi:hypothetical protein